jgi:ribosome-associated protein
VTSRQKALLVAELARSKKGEGVVVLDMRRLSSITDFFVILTASSITRAQAIIDHIRETLFKRGQTVCGVEGLRDGVWTLLDAYDVVVHVFNPEARRFYNLEALWSDAPRIRICRGKGQKRKKTSRKGSKKR